MHRTLFAVMGLVVFGGCSNPNQYEAPPPPPVKVASPVQQSVTLYLEETGQTEAVQRAEVRVQQVGGILREINFTPGAEVKQDDVLYVIDPQPYVAARNAARANLSAAKGDLSAARAEIDVSKADVEIAEVAVVRTESEFTRQGRMLKDNATSQSQWEQAKAERDGALANRDASKAKLTTAEADVEKAEASVEKAQADLEQAVLDLGYTTVKAPIRGRVTKTEVKVGSLVQDGTHLATIVDDDPVYANFSISERYLLELQENSDRQRDEEIDLTKIDVDLRRASDEGFPFAGHLEYYDQEGVDQTTGTLMMRGIFENPKRQLLPGLFVRVRVPIGIQENALLVPETAIGRDQAGPYSLVVTGDQTVERKNVTLGPRVGDMIVISKGLEAGDSVIIAGLQRARPGGKVDPTATTLSPPKEL